MKKPLTTIVTGLLLCFTANAQHIPDKSFANVLHNIYSDCIDANNNLLPAAQSLKRLIVPNQAIISLEGVEGFSSLIELDIHNNTLITSLPGLPGTLTTLEISHTGINNIVSLPPKLEKFYCEDCPLTSLPALPATLETIRCDNTQLTSLPDLPESLMFLHVNDVPISNLPKLPKKLLSLEIGGTKITTLPSLPDALNYIKFPGHNIPCCQSNNPNLEVRDVDRNFQPTIFCPGYPKPAEVIAEKKPEQKVETVNKPEQKMESANKVTLQNSNEQAEGKCVSGNCTNGIGTYVSKNGEATVTYKGSFKDDMMDGKGTLTSPDGTYTGEWKKNYPEGAGTMVFKSGKKSTGIWKEGKFWSGTGDLEFEEKESYYGGVKENMPDGQGVFNYPNGKTFTGIFSKGNAVNGKGYIFYPDDKSSYEGTLVNGKFSGKGTYTNPEGQVFIGNFADGELNGHGEWVGTSGNKYSGDFKNGNFDGYGKMKYNDGMEYLGYWLNSKRNGEGSLYNANGSLEYAGDWSNGEMTHPERSGSYKKELWEDAKKIFSRVTFKGRLTAENVNIEITDEYHLNSDYSLYGTHEVIMIYDNDDGKDDDKYRFKMNFTGTYDPVTNKIHTDFGSTIYKDVLPDNRSWTLIGVDATVYTSSKHPGYYVITGKDTGDEFAETDYY